MTTNLWTEHSIDAGCFGSTKGALLSLSNDATTRDELLHSQLVLYFFDDGGLRDLDLHQWKVVSMARSGRADAREGFALGEDGELIVLAAGGPVDHALGGQAGGPVRRGPLRKIRAIGEDMVVVGMRHQVYAVQSDAPWRDLSPRVPARPLGGFEAVAGPHLDDFVCAGWRGEIWRRRGGAWTQVDSPTNVLITDLAHGPNDTYVACGLAGLVVVGRGDSWRVLDQGAFKSNLNSVAIDGDRIYLTSMHGLYELRDEVLVDVDFGDTPPPTNAHTVQVIEPGTIGLIGSKDLYLRDTGVWRRFE